MGHTVTGGGNTASCGQWRRAADVTCTGSHLDGAKECLAVLQVHHLTLDFILYHVNKSQLRDNALPVAIQTTTLVRGSTLPPPPPRRVNTPENFQ